MNENNDEFNIAFQAGFEAGCEAVLEAALKAVHAELTLPLLLGIGTLTAALSLDPERGQAIAKQLRQQAESCRGDSMGRGYLESLARLAAGIPASDPQAEGEASVRSLLKLIQGGLSDGPQPPETP